MAVLVSSPISENLPTFNLNNLNVTPPRPYGQRNGRSRTFSDMTHMSKQYFFYIAQPVLSFYVAHRAMCFMIMVVTATLISVILAVVLAQILMLTNTYFTLANQEVPARVNKRPPLVSLIVNNMLYWQISISADIVTVDTTESTLTFDWNFSPAGKDCSNDTLVANIFFDQ